ncbi:MAG: flagellar export chaperone FlgN [Ignavibacteriae bacterium]|nr:flagellar export chaperone FlgN [Ignavibacteriota bacterium]MCB9206090.1 flagellar export chaperone FlgN [Ignavibacteriales bacterium]MCB9209363.1 flagellar export chaperone FlgN [Ignavibacteriales bacterium]
MNLQKLLAILEKQEKNLKNLLKIGIEKQETLVSNNHKKLKELVAVEEQNLLNIQLTEESRLEEMHSIFNFYKINNDRYKLNILVEHLKGSANEKLLETITAFENRIKKSIEEITRVNHLNMTLIQQSRSLINATIHAVINSSNRSMLDRKA